MKKSKKVTIIHKTIQTNKKVENKWNPSGPQIKPKWDPNAPQSTPKLGSQRIVTKNPPCSWLKPFSIRCYMLRRETWPTDFGVMSSTTAQSSAFATFAIFETFKFLQTQELFVVSMVSREWNSAMRHDSTWSQKEDPCETATQECTGYVSCLLTTVSHILSKLFQIGLECVGESAGAADNA